MREVASFMQMYPAYKLRDVLDEYAVTFFTLLNEGYRLRYDYAILLAQIAIIPHADQKDRTAFMQNLEWASKHPSDILKTDSEGSTPADIKKILGG